MTIAHDFAYLKPGTLDEALSMLAEQTGDVRLLSGGTDLVPWLRDGAARPDTLIDLKGIDGLDAIEVSNDRLHIGARATFSELLGSDAVRSEVPMLMEAAATVASVGVRNRATLVGNLCSAVPSCDAGPALLAHEADIHAIGPGGSRIIPIAAWFTGPRRTSLGAGEIVTGVSIPLPNRHGACYAKLSRYRGEDLSQAGVAVVVHPDGTHRVAFGAVGPVPFRAPAIEAVLTGTTPDPETLAAADALVEEAISPISDVRATKEYRAHMCRVMLRRALEAAHARLAGGGPDYGTQVV